MKPVLCISAIPVTVSLFRDRIPRFLYGPERSAASRRESNPYLAIVCLCFQITPQLAPRHCLDNGDSNIGNNRLPDDLPIRSGLLA